jgi:hypothetical protein
MIELKKLLRPPFVVELSSFPRMIKSISFTGSPSREMYVFSGHRKDTSRSQMASRSWSSSQRKRVPALQNGMKSCNGMCMKFQLAVEAMVKSNRASTRLFPSKYSK